MALALFLWGVSPYRPVLVGVRALRFRDELAGWIRGQGFSTFVTSVGREAVEWLRRTPEALSFLDRDLDRVGGEEVWRTVCPEGNSSTGARSVGLAVGLAVDAVVSGGVNVAGDAGGRRPAGPPRRAGRLVLLAERPTKELWLTALSDGVATVLPLPAEQSAVLLALRLADRD